MVVALGKFGDRLRRLLVSKRITRRCGVFVQDYAFAARRLSTFP